MPGRIRADDLPAEIRRKLVGRARRSAPPAARSTPGDDIPPRWRCRGCGKVFTAWAAAQRHAGAPEHRRIEIDLKGEW
jgi:rubredoxin